MTSSYKKYFKNIPFASKFLLDAAFADKFMTFNASIGVYEDTDPNYTQRKEMVTFLSKSVNPFWKLFRINIIDTVDEFNIAYYVADPFMTPHIKSKKKRAIKHAKLVALSNWNRSRNRYLEHISLPFEA